jgi:hypothetical protein
LSYLYLGGAVVALQKALDCGVVAEEGRVVDVVLGHD